MNKELEEVTKIIQESNKDLPVIKNNTQETYEALEMTNVAINDLAENISLNSDKLGKIDGSEEIVEQLKRLVNENEEIKNLLKPSLDDLEERRESKRTPSSINPMAAGAAGAGLFGMEGGMRNNLGQDGNNFGLLDALGLGAAASFATGGGGRIAGVFRGMASRSISAAIMYIAGYLLDDFVSGITGDENMGDISRMATWGAGAGYMIGGPWGAFIGAAGGLIVGGAQELKESLLEARDAIDDATNRIQEAGLDQQETSTEVTAGEIANAAVGEVGADAANQMSAQELYDTGMARLMNVERFGTIMSELRAQIGNLEEIGSGVNQTVASDRLLEMLNVMQTYMDQGRLDTAAAAELQTTINTLGDRVLQGMTLNDLMNTSAEELGVTPENYQVLLDIARFLENIPSVESPSTSGIPQPSVETPQPISPEPISSEPPDVTTETNPLGWPGWTPRDETPTLRAPGEIFNPDRDPIPLPQVPGVNDPAVNDSILLPREQPPMDPLESFVEQFSAISNRLLMGNMFGQYPDGGSMAPLVIDARNQSNTQIASGGGSTGGDRGPVTTADPSSPVWTDLGYGRLVV